MNERQDVPIELLELAQEAVAVELAALDGAADHYMIEKQAQVQDLKGRVAWMIEQHPATTE